VLRIPARGRHITKETQTIAPRLVGFPLATFRRRLFAFLIDISIFGVLTFILFLALTTWSFHRDAPTLISRARVAFNDTTLANVEHEKNVIITEFSQLIVDRCPEAFPRDVTAMIRANDTDGVREYWDEFQTTVGFGQGKTRVIEAQDGTKQFSVGMDLMMGQAASVFGWSGLFIVWSTFWPFVTGGRSVGKAVFRIRIVRLDGNRLKLWDCFARAGGYGASAATLMLGFLESIWHPNRQAIHDKIASTVVVRGAPPPVISEGDKLEQE
jgi:uncharacterized RDD family membrane protein YckC